MPVSRRALLSAPLAVPLGVPALQAVQDRFAAAMSAETPSGAEGYALDPGIAYLNHASIGTVPRAVLDAHIGYLEACETNPWLHMWSDAWVPALDATREAAAVLLGVGPDEVAIGHNTTEGFNLLARGLPLGPGDEVVFSNLNHAGASIAWDHAAERAGFRVRRFEIPFEAIPALTSAELTERVVGAVGPATRVLVLPHADNMFGLRHDLTAIAAGAKEKGVEWVAVDAAQTLGAVPLDLGEAPAVDAVCCSPHKWVECPKGLGLLVLRRPLQEVLRPLVVTWGQERYAGTVRRFEDYGTRDLPAVLALGDALRRRAAQGIEWTAEQLAGRVAALRERVAQHNGLSWRGPADFARGVSLAAVGLPARHDAGEVARALWSRHRVVVRGFSGPGTNHLRVSPGLPTTAADLDRLFEALRALGVLAA